MTSYQNISYFYKKLLILYLLGFPIECLKYLSEDDLLAYRERVADMFYHAYNGYLQHAYPFDELRPITCDGHDTWGSYSLTLIDALDTLVVLGNHTEFQRVSELLINTLDFDRDINVSVFETNIRVVGGLLSAHLLSRRAGVQLEDGWPCSGPLLRLAEKVATKLLPAFDTPTGMPYGTVNLKYGVPKDETPVACTAGVGTFLVEFGALTRLTGNPAFEKAAQGALDGLWKARSAIDLVGNHIDVKTGKWTALDAGIGGGVDSYFEYLVKGAILFQDPKLMEHFRVYEAAAEKYLKKEDWYMWAHMSKGTVTQPMFHSLECFWPGAQCLVGEVDKAMKTLHNYHQVWKQLGFTPEFYNIPKGEAHGGREGYPLRPELIESVMYLYKATKDPYLIEVAVDIFESIEHETRTRCGYASVKDVRDHRLDNRMESFFLAETTKYLYLMFDQENFLHNTGERGTFIETPSGSCVVETGFYVYNTEAHPIDGAALHCCSAEKTRDDLDLADLHDNIDLLELFDLGDYETDIFSRRGDKLMRPTKKEPAQKESITQTVDISNVIDPGSKSNKKVIHLDMSQLQELQDGGDSAAQQGLLSQLKNQLPAGSIQDVLNKAVQLLGQLGDVGLGGNAKQITLTLDQPLDQSSAEGEAQSECLSDTESEPHCEAKISESDSQCEGKNEPENVGACDPDIPRDTDSHVTSEEDQSESCNIPSTRSQLVNPDECPLGPHVETPHGDETRKNKATTENDDDDSFPARLFMCLARSFSARLSVMGQMFSP